MIRLLLILTILLAACGSGEPPAPTVAPMPTFTPTVEAAAVVEPVLEEAELSIQRLVDDSDQVMDLGGVEIALTNVGLLSWADALAEMPDLAMFAETEMFAGVTALGFLTVAVTNRTDKNIDVYPDQGVVVIGSEQVELSQYLIVSDMVGGEFFPGVIKQGDIVFALKNTGWAEIADGAQVRYVAQAPIDREFNTLADGEYQFVSQVAPVP